MRRLVYIRRVLIVLTVCMLSRLVGLRIINVMLSKHSSESSLGKSKATFYRFQLESEATQPTGIPLLQLRIVKLVISTPFVLVLDVRMEQIHTFENTLVHMFWALFIWNMPWITVVDLTYDKTVTQLMWKYSARNWNGKGLQKANHHEQLFRRKLSSRLSSFFTGFYRLV